ncbi:hypothetical protein CQ14_13040 [Bradyrhizobium lablabi]|uniref:DUF2239 domain-containing protein n=1 Tax=Bradyrhizobium lablabi TaxID=722472 RepID=A0A0R3MJ28_9BRAD|nr:DUF2239 family protein [Bradyrhizobium lablabi]KRR17299.1 hypothetical protein CQ14_13040 [Bradyrhizobium lablabi]
MADKTRPQFTAFIGPQRLAAGPLAEVALAVMQAARKPVAPPIIIFSDATGQPIDLDLRGTERDVIARLPQPAPDPETASDESAEAPRGRGRPKLGVVAREVTLLPRHWEWLGAQPGGASVALRKLVEEARRANGDLDRARAARDAAYRFMSVMAGSLAGFEEASRALFADDRRRFVGLVAGWPDDIRDHVVKLAFSDRAEP